MSDNIVEITPEMVAENQKAFVIIYDLLSMGQFPGSVATELGAVRRFVGKIIEDQKVLLERVKAEAEDTPAPMKEFSADTISVGEVQAEGVTNGTAS